MYTNSFPISDPLKAAFWTVVKTLLSRMLWNKIMEIPQNSSLLSLQLFRLDPNGILENPADLVSLEIPAKRFSQMTYSQLHS